MPDGSQYEGQWKDNQRHGEGTELSASGTVFRGQYWRNMRHGPGELTYLNGPLRGVWDRDDRKGQRRSPVGTGKEDTVGLRVFGRPIVLFALVSPPARPALSLLLLPS